MIPMARAQELARMAEAAVERDDPAEIEALLKDAADARDFFGSLAQKLMEALPDGGAPSVSEVNGGPQTPEATDPAPE